MALRHSRAFSVIASVSCAIVAMVTPAQASNLPTTSVTVSVPGPLMGCSGLSPSINDATRGVLDLTTPSAFTDSPTGEPEGQNGVILSAELVSLQPQSVVYEVAPDIRWSNGVIFNGQDFVWWWHQNLSVMSPQHAGYADIASITTTASGDAVTVTFKHPYAAWPDLFRDVEERGYHPSCSLRSALLRPSLGPYRLVSLSNHAAELVANPQWKWNYNRITRISLTTNLDTPSNEHTPFVQFLPGISSSQVADVTQHPILSSGFSQEQALLEWQMSTSSAIVSSSSERQSWRAAVHLGPRILHWFSSFTPSLATSSTLLYTSDQASATSTGPTSATTTTSPSITCAGCGFTWLLHHGFTKQVGQLWYQHHLVVFSVAVGPSADDAIAARLLRTSLADIGVTVHFLPEPSEAAACAAAASGDVTSALFTRAVADQPYEAAQAFLNIQPHPAFWSGYWSNTLSILARTALDNFNPVSAVTDWLAFDTAAQRSGVVTPLLSPPAMTVWSPHVQNVQVSDSASDLLDGLTNWGVTQ